MPRALKTATFAEPARSKALASLYVMPLASPSRCARAKWSAANETSALPPNAIAPAHAAASTCAGDAFEAYAATPTTTAATGAPRSTVCRSRLTVGAATSTRADGIESSLTHARSRPDQVVVMRRRLETTRAPATSGSPSRFTISIVAPSQGTTRASPAVTIASTPTSSPASTTIASPARTSEAGSSRVSSPWIAFTRASSARSTLRRAASTRTRARPTIASTAIAAADARPAKIAMVTARGSDAACAQHAATIAPPVGARTTSGCGSDGSRPVRWTRKARATHATTASGSRATSATEPSSPIAGTKAPDTRPSPSRNAVAWLPASGSTSTDSRGDGRCGVSET